MRTFLPSPWAWAALGAVAAPAMRSARASSADSAKASDSVAAREGCEVAVRSPWKPERRRRALSGPNPAERRSLLHHIVISFSPQPPPPKGSRTFLPVTGREPTQRSGGCQQPFNTPYAKALLTTRNRMRKAAWARRERWSNLGPQRRRPARRTTESTSPAHAGGRDDQPVTSCGP